MCSTFDNEISQANWKLCVDKIYAFLSPSSNERTFVLIAAAVVGFVESTAAITSLYQIERAIIGYIIQFGDMNLLGSNILSIIV